KNCTKTGDTLRRSKDGSQDRERANAHIEERPYLIERGRCRVPGLNTPPVRLSIRQTHCTEAPLSDHLPCRLLSLTQNRYRSTPQMAALLLGQFDQSLCIPRAKSQRFFTIHIFASQ